MKKTSQRGSALLVSVIAVLVISVIGVGIIRFAGREVAGASASMHEQALAACADAARQRLMAQFHALGFQPTSILPLNPVPLGTTSGAAQTWAVGGHYDTPPANIQIAQVSYLPDNAFGPTTAVRDITAVVPLVGQGGKPIKVVVHCQDGNVDGGRTMEVEFALRFGM